MKKLLVIACFSGCWIHSVSADTHYVNVNNLAPVSPYTNWLTAATEIQDAVDVATAGDTVLVASGIYDVGGRVASGYQLTNRVVIDKAISVESVSGIGDTIIKGEWDPATTNGSAAIRCVWMTNGASLTGFTITNGATLNTGGNDFERSGGGVWAQSAASVVNRCLLTGGHAAYTGGGGHGGTFNQCEFIGNASVTAGGGARFATLNNCLLRGNSSVFGGGAAGSSLVGCTVSGNSGASGGGTYNCSMDNSIVYFNSPFENGPVNTVRYTCTQPLLAGDGNVTNEPLFVHAASGNYRLPSSSPCRDAGTNSVVVGAVDLDGNLRNENMIVDMGAYEFQLSATGATHYVDLNNPAPMWPHATWDTAANTIQEAVDAASTGDTVLVSNGVYETGGRAAAGFALINRVVIDKPITVQSVNGADHTIIKGEWVPGAINGPSAVRCVWMDDAASLVGFTLTQGATFSGATDDGYGGGSYGGVLSNCSIMSNSAYKGAGLYSATATRSILQANQSESDGGGARSCVLNNCLITANHAGAGGGGINYTTANNCTIVWNSAQNRAGGSLFGEVNNCINYFNTAGLENPNHRNTTERYSCTTPHPGGTGNISDHPQLASVSHLSIGSPCIGAGSTNYATGTDLDGEAWGTPPSMGCDELIAGSVLGELGVDMTAGHSLIAVGEAIDFGAQIEGSTTGSSWDFGDGTVVSNTPFVSHAWASTGTYSVVLSAYNTDYPAGVSATAQVTVLGPSSRFVDVNNPTPQAPYTNWSTAATVIQDAVDVASSSGTVVVTDGVYDLGGAVIHGSMSNRVALTNGISLRSENGAEVTFIRGQGPLGDGAVRCVYVGAGSTLAGFTLTNGATRIAGNNFTQRSAGGVWCETSAVVQDCIVDGNSSDLLAGGSYQGLLSDCVLRNNSTSYEGGGAYNGTLRRCRVIGNTADRGGGISRATLYSGLVQKNYARDKGGGAGEASYLKNCNVIDNTAKNEGGGVYRGSHNNCIVWNNTAPEGPNWQLSSMRYSCTSPLLGGLGNIEVDPQLASVTHLSAQSPCIGVGSPDYTAGNSNDIDGEIWLDSPSIGCDEYHPDAVVGDLSVAIEVPQPLFGTGYATEFEALIEGRTTASEWSFGDGTTVSNQPFVTQSWTSAGTYEVVLTAFNNDHPAGVSATVTVTVVEKPLFHVDVNSLNAVEPYATWATAAANLQSAMDAVTLPGSLVLVTNGVYETGGRIVHGVLSNRVVLTNGVTLRSVNGPEVTVIRGQGPVGDGAVRCAYVGSDCLLDGFTLTNGATRASGDLFLERSGGGVLCETGGRVSGCILVDNVANNRGGGAYRAIMDHCEIIGNSAVAGAGVTLGTLSHCLIVSNSATGGAAVGGGAWECTLTNCELIDNTSARLGGGAAYSTLVDCLVQGNTSSDDGGGAYESVLSRCRVVDNTSGRNGGGVSVSRAENCLLLGNVARWGGGAWSRSLENCTVVSNTAVAASGEGGGAWQSTIHNCIVYYNQASTKVDWSGGSITFSCSSQAGGQNNTTNAPEFSDVLTGDFNLSPMSPCIDAGLTAEALFDQTDVAGNPRVLNKQVDIGAYEFFFDATLKVRLEGVE